MFYPIKNYHHVQKYRTIVHTHVFPHRFWRKSIEIKRKTTCSHVGFDQTQVHNHHRGQRHFSSFFFFFGSKQRKLSLIKRRYACIGGNTVYSSKQVVIEPLPLSVILEIRCAAMFLFLTHQLKETTSSSTKWNEQTFIPESNMHVPISNTQIQRSIMNRTKQRNYLETQCRASCTVMFDIPISNK